MPLVGQDSNCGGFSPNILVHLVGRLSNPSAALGAVFEALPDKPLEPKERLAPEPEKGRLGNGVVQRAVVKVLAADDGPMRCADIYRAVEGVLGHPVSKDSVSWCLATGAKDKAPRFDRVDYGTYRLNRRWASASRRTMRSVAARPSSRPGVDSGPCEMKSLPCPIPEQAPRQVPLCSSHPQANAARDALTAPQMSRKLIDRLV